MTSFALVGEVLLGEASCSAHIFQPREECAVLRRNQRLLCKPRPLERHWYRSLENPVESRSHFACQGSIIQRAPLMPGAASTVDSAQDLGESHSPRAIAVGADESGDLGEQRSGIVTMSRAWKP
jgi:hypothetical protein